MVNSSHDMVLVLDFGAQYSQLIARRVRECGVYSQIVPFTISADEVRKMMPKGIIFSGGPSSVKTPGSPRPDAEIFKLGIPILGICYGLQVMSERSMVFRISRLSTDHRLFSHPSPITVRCG